MAHYATQYIMNILERIKKIFPTPSPMQFSTQELKNSTRIFKSKTPKYTIDWYIKWIASIFILSAMSVRGLVDYIYYDMIFSMIGLSLWVWVSVIWKDRALIMLNIVGFLLVIRNFFESLRSE